MSRRLKANKEKRVDTAFEFPKLESPFEADAETKSSKVKFSDLSNVKLCALSYEQITEEIDKVLSCRDFVLDQVYLRDEKCFALSEWDASEHWLVKELCFDPWIIDAMHANYDGKYYEKFMELYYQILDERTPVGGARVFGAHYGRKVYLGGWPFNTFACQRLEVFDSDVSFDYTRKDVFEFASIHSKSHDACIVADDLYHLACMKSRCGWLATVSADIQSYYKEHGGKENCVVRLQKCENGSYMLWLSHYDYIKGTEVLPETVDNEGIELPALICEELGADNINENYVNLAYYDDKYTVLCSKATEILTAVKAKLGTIEDSIEIVEHVEPEVVESEAAESEAAESEAPVDSKSALFSIDRLGLSAIFVIIGLGMVLLSHTPVFSVDAVAASEAASEVEQGVKVFTKIFASMLTFVGVGVLLMGVWLTFRAVLGLDTDA